MLKAHYLGSMDPLGGAIISDERYSAISGALRQSIDDICKNQLLNSRQRTAMKNKVAERLEERLLRERQSCHSATGSGGTVAGRRGSVAVDTAAWQEDMQACHPPLRPLTLP
jgi:hypothetical protein